MLNKEDNGGNGENEKSEVGIDSQGLRNAAHGEFRSQRVRVRQR